MALGNISILDYPGTIGGAGGTANFTVVYSSFKTVSLAEYSDSAGTHQVAGNVVEVGSDSTTYEYYFNISPNSTDTAQMWPVTFSGIDEEDTRISQYARINQIVEIVPDFNVYISPEEHTIDSQTQEITSSISIDGVLDFGDLNISVDSFDNNVVSVNITEPYQVGDYLWASSLEIRMYPNETAYPVTSSIVVYAAEIGRGASSTASVTIYQEPGSGSSYRVEAPATWSVPQAGGNNLELSPVNYYGGTDSAIDAPTYPDWITGWSVLSSSQGTKAYGFNVQPNSNSLSRTGDIVFGMGGGQATASTRVTQLGLDDILEVTVSPATSTVGSYTTQSNIVVNYVGAVGYVTESSVSGPGSPTLVLSSSTVSGNDIIARYKVLYPSNSTDSTLTRTATFSIKSGSQVKVSASSVITQLPSSSYQSIYLNPSVASISSSTTTLSVQAFYAGIDNIDNVVTPVANVNGWSATVASYTASPTDVSVIWNIVGPANLDYSPKTIVFTFNATGITSEGYLTIVQGGTGDKPLTASGSIVAWKDTNTIVGNGDSWEAVCQDSSGNLLFDERIYKAPDQAYLRINFNRLAESFLEPRDLSNSQSNIFSFNTILREDGGYERLYSYRVLDDWSYEDRDPGDRNILSHPYQKEVAIGSYLVFSTMNDEDRTNRVAFLRVSDSQDTLEARVVYAGKYSDIRHLVDPEIHTPCSTISTWEGSGKGSNPVTLYYTYKVIDNIKYAIYYYNKFGGWDSFMIKGPVVPSVDATRNNYMNSRRNTRTYQVGVVDKYRINTGILTDEESLAIPEIVSSPRVILHKIDKAGAGTLIPVKASTNSVEKKTFRNQGHQFATYRFDLEADLNQIRR